MMGRRKRECGVIESVLFSRFFFGYDSIVFGAFVTGTTREKRKLSTANVSTGKLRKGIRPPPRGITAL